MGRTGGTPGAVWLYWVLAGEPSLGVRHPESGGRQIVKHKGKRVNSICRRVLRGLKE